LAGIETPAKHHKPIKQTIMERTIEPIPDWALCALINDDWSGLTDEDCDLIADWQSNSRLCVISPVDYNEYFTSVPAFGKACMVIDCICETF